MFLGRRSAGICTNFLKYGSDEPMQNKARSIEQMADNILTNRITSSETSHQTNTILRISFNTYISTNNPNRFPTVCIDSNHLILQLSFFLSLSHSSCFISIFIFIYNFQLLILSYFSNYTQSIKEWDPPILATNVRILFDRTFPCKLKFQAEIN